MARRKNLAQTIREARLKAGKETGNMWVIRLSFPATDVFCERTPPPGMREEGPDGIRDDIGVIAAMIAQGIQFDLIDTDRADIVLVRSTMPWEVMCLREEFMPPVMKALRRSSIHGSYYQSGTLLKYEF